MSKRPGAPTARGVTVREALHRALKREARSAKELSSEVGVAEKEVAMHLEHLQKSLRRHGEQLEVTPAECIACGFAFTARTRLTKPGRCPECSSERVAPPLFRVVTRSGGAAETKR